MACHKCFFFHFLFISLHIWQTLQENKKILTAEKFSLLQRPSDIENVKSSGASQKCGKIMTKKFCFFSFFYDRWAWLTIQGHLGHLIVSDKARKNKKAIACHANDIIQKLAPWVGLPFSHVSFKVSCCGPQNTDEPSIWHWTHCYSVVCWISSANESVQEGTSPLWWQILECKIK